MAGTGGRRRRWWIYLGTVTVLAALSALDPAGLRRYQALSRDVGAMRADNARLAEENTRLAREVRALRAEPAALERAVREELRWIRPGERVYWFGAETSTAP
jgi:cell division protein FtsB